MNKKRYIKYLGKFITILSLLFVIKLILSFDIDFKLLFKLDVLVIVILLAFVLSNSVVLNSLAWKRLIEMLSSSQIKILDVVHIYAKSNISKYLPGNVMHYASRNIVGNKYSINQMDMLYSTILEIILKILSAFILIIAFVRDEFEYVIRELDDKIYLDMNILLTIIIFMIFFIVALLYFKNKKTINECLKLGSLFYSFAIYTLIFFLNAGVFLVVSKIIASNTVPNENLLCISGIYIIAWLLGYLTPGSPGGIGVREAIMILMLNQIYSTEDIVLISIIIRLITVLADVIAYFIDFLIERKVGIVNETNHSNTML